MATKQEIRNLTRQWLADYLDQWDFQVYPEGIETEADCREHADEILRISDRIRKTITATPPEQKG